MIDSNNLRSDCGDLRFTNENENRSLDYWLQSGCDTNSTSIFLELPSIEANSTETIYMYYGNEENTSESDITIGSQENPAKSCNQIYRRIENAPNTTYHLDPDQDENDVHEARCDMGVREEGWTLLYNYDHEGGTSPGPTEGEWPLDHSALRHQDNIDDLGYNQTRINSLRLRCETSNHDRIVHYINENDNAIEGILTDGTSVGYDEVSSYSYLMPEHTGNLPEVAGSDTGESEPNDTLFGPSFPMYEGGAHHWSIGSPTGGFGDRWECDDYPDGNQHDTLHQIWFNSVSDAPLVSQPPNYTIGQQTRSKKLVDRKTYLGDKPRTFFAGNQTVTLEVEGEYAESPLMTLKDPDGTEILSRKMKNNGKYELNYRVNGSTGWYDAKIENFEWDNAFYRGEKWENNFTDSNGNIYSFRRRINVSEPREIDREDYPIDRFVNFTFEPDKKSVRIVSWNGTRMLEIPSQIYNTSGSLESANVVFLSSLKKGENRTYFVMSAKDDYSRSYESLMDGEGRSIVNSFYNASFKRSNGGLLSDAKNLLGLKQDIGGSDPLEYYPQLDIGLSSYSARVDSTSSVEINRGAIKTDLNVNGNLNDLDRYPYSLECSFYAKNSYMVCEKNLSSRVSESWDQLVFNGLVMEDGRFSWTSYKGASQENLSLSKQGGDISQDIDSPEWISFYNNVSGDAIAEIFIESSFDQQKNRISSVRESAGLDYYSQQVIDGSTSVNSGDFFYTKTARSIYNGLSEIDEPEKLYTSLNNEPLVNIGEEKTNDQEDPSLEKSGNLSSNSSSPVKLYSRWSDDTFLQEYNLTVKGNGKDGENTTIVSVKKPIRNETSFTPAAWINSTLKSSEINSGMIYANITVKDVAGNEKSNVQKLEVKDTTAPKISNLTNTPSDNASVDPDSTINITANITEYEDVSRVTLYYTNSSSDKFRSLEMEQASNSKFETKYYSSFKPGYNLTYSYLVETVDNNGNSRNSSMNNLFALWDYTWNADFDLRNRSATFGTSKDTGNITINNTGDFELTFDLSAGAFNDRTSMNGSQLEESYKVDSAETRFLSLDTSTRQEGSTEGVDQVNLDISSDNGSPNNLSETYEILTSTGGPFLYTEFRNLNSTVEVGSSQSLEALVTNKGSERAENVNITFNLPEGWDTQDSLASPNSLGVDVGSSYDYRISYSVPDSISPGTYEVKATSRSKNETESSTVEIEVVDTSDTVVEETGGTGGGGGPSGPSSQEEVESSEDRFFNTSESFDIVRGRDQDFTFGFENPTDYNLTNISIEVSGIQSQYLELKTDFIEDVPVNSSRNIAVNITAPEYFQTGDYTLNFNITGKGEEPLGLYTTYFDFNLEKQINLGVKAIPEENASELVNESQELARELNSSGMNTENLQEKVAEARDRFESGEYGSVRETFQEIEEEYRTAREVDSGLQELDTQISSAQAQGLSVGNARRVADLAEAAMKRGAYSTASERLEEAQNIYQLETAGEVNWVYEIRSNWRKVLAGLFIFSAGGFLAWLRYRLYRINRRLSTLNDEEQSIEDLKLQAQKKTFERKDMSLSEYEDATEDYNDDIIDIIEERVQLETARANLTNFKERDSLAQERDKLEELVRETQEEYVEGNIGDSEVYEEKVEELTERLSEVEGEIAEIDARAEVRETHTIGKILERIPVVSTGGVAK